MNSSEENKIIKDNAGLVFSQAYSFSTISYSDFDDYVQCGYIGLLKAARNYDPSRNTKFSTFATICIRREIIKERKRIFKRKSRYKDCGFVDAPYYEKDPLWEYNPDDLSDIEKNIILLRAKGHTFSEMGKALGFTKSWARELFNNAIKKIRISNA